MKRGVRARKVLAIRRGMKKRRQIMKSLLTSRMSSKKLLNIHHFKEVVSKGYVNGARQGTSPDFYISGALDFRLDDCANIVNLSSVYDQVRLNKVVVEFIPLTNVMNGTNTASSGAINLGAYSTQTLYVGQFYTCIDPDDSNVLTSKSAIQQYSNCRSAPVYKYMKRVLTPAIQGTIQQTPSVTTTQAKYKQWFDMGNTGTIHYGVKWFLDCGNLNIDPISRVYEIKCTYYYSCKGQR